MTRSVSWQSVTPQVVYELVGLYGTHQVGVDVEETRQEPFVTLRTTSQGSNALNSWKRFTFGESAEVKVIEGESN